MAQTLTGKKVLLVVAPDQFRDEELIEPRKALEEAGADVTVASTKEGTAKGMLGATVTPTLLVQDANAADWDGVVVVGGMGSPEHLWDCAPLHSLVQDRAAAGKIVGAICLSGAVLGKAGVAKGKKATCWPEPSAIAALEDGGAIYEKAGVIVDGNIVTGDGPPSAPEFGAALVRALGGS